MAKTISNVTFEGFDELGTKLKLLGDKDSLIAAKAGVSAAGRAVLKRARTNIAQISPGETPRHRLYTKEWVWRGFAATQLRYSAFIRSNKTGAIVRIGVSREAFYAVQFIELGVPAYGTPANPWLTPAFEASRSEMMQKAGAAMRKKINDIAKKRIAKGAKSLGKAALAFASR